jgi:predicted ATP-grasp superfamily ATP-dependent carboligase
MQWGWPTTCSTVDSVRGYVASFGGLHVAALFAADDALPGLLEGPLLIFILCARLARGDGV